MATSSIQRAAASGSTAVFSVPFPYLDKTHVQVRVAGVLKTSGVDYTWPTSSTIQLTAGNPVAGTIVERRRVTPVDPLTVFQPGNLDSGDLNVAELQALYVAQEAVDDEQDRNAAQWSTPSTTPGLPGTGGTIAKGAENNLPAYDAGGNLKDSGTSIASLLGLVAIIQTVNALWLSVFAVATYAEAWLVLKLNGSLSTRPLIKALVPQVGMSVLLTETGRVGNFVWRTGDYSAKVATDTLEGMYLKADSVAASAGAWVREHEGLIKPSWFGAAADNTTDDTAAIQAAINVAGDVFLSVGKTYRTTDTINLTVPGQRIGGLGTLHCNLGNGAAAKPAVYIDPTATEAVVRDITVDHDGSTYVDPTAHAGNFIWGSAVFLAADDSKAINVTVKNAWDNGVAICQFSGSTGSIVANNPLRAAALGIKGYNNGCGNHVAGSVGKQGACVDLASGTQCVVADCIDNQSAMGFILDVGAGGQGVFSNCVSYSAKLDVAHPTNGSGLGFYSGGSNSAFINCQAFYSGLHGWWIDATANNDSYTNCEAYACQRHGFRIDAGNSAFIGCTARANSQAAANTYDGFALTHTTAKTGLSFVGCRGMDTQQRYGFAASPTGAGSIQGEIIGGLWEGTTGKILVGSQAISVVYTGVNGGKVGIGHTAPRTIIDVAGPDFNGTSVGDTTNLGQGFFGPLSNPNKRVAVGYGTGDDSGIIQVIEAGVSTKPLKLNPAGGVVTVGNGSLLPENDGVPSLGSAAKRWVNAFFASGGVLNFNNGNYTVTHSAGLLTFSGSVLCGSTLGYAPGIGAGGTVTQATSRTTAVTLDKPTGQITTNNASLAAGASAKFTVNNAAVGAKDTILLSIASGTTTDLTDVKVQGVATGGFNIVVANRHASTAETGAIVINFAVIKGQTN